MRRADPSVGEEESGECEQSVSTTVGIGGLFVLPGSDSVAAFNAGATAHLVCSSLVRALLRIYDGRAFHAFRLIRPLRDFDLVTNA